MFTGLLHSHVLFVVLFLVLYIVKVFLLLANKPATLAKFRSKTKIADAIISSLFLITGIALAFQSGMIHVGSWFWVKLAVIVIALPIGIVAFKKNNKLLALVSLAGFIYAYGISEVKSPVFKQERSFAKKEIAPGATSEMGEQIHLQYCVACHGEDGTKRLSGAADLSKSTIPEEDVIEIIKKGKKSMAAYERILTPQEIEAVSDYIIKLRK